jgi:AraC-like DNA-binding protein
MNREDLRERMYEMTDTEKERQLSGTEIPSPFYQYLESISGKDENGVYLLSSNFDYYENFPNSTGIWGNFMTSPHQSVLRIKRASRFYHEPMAKGDFISIRYIYSGDSQITTKASSFTLHQNDICLFSNNFVFSQYLPDEKDIVFTLMFEREYLIQNILQYTKINRIATSFILNYIMEQKHRQNYIIFHGGENDMIRLLFENILCEYIDPSPNSTILTENYIRLMMLETFCCNYDCNKEPLNKSNPIATDILDYIDSHFSSVTLASLSSKFGYNSKYMSRMIRQLTGRGFTEYVNSKRMDRACLLLSNSNLSIHDIIEECGLSNETYFYRCFRTQFHMTPNEYRNQTESKKHPSSL